MNDSRVMVENRQIHVEKFAEGVLTVGSSSSSHDKVSQNSSNSEISVSHVEYVGGERPHLSHSQFPWTDGMDDLVLSIIGVTHTRERIGGILSQ